jgi:hypothetical protein
MRHGDNVIPGSEWRDALAVAVEALTKIDRLIDKEPVAASGTGDTYGEIQGIATGALRKILGRYP